MINEILDAFQQDYEIVIQNPDTAPQLAEYQTIKKEALTAIYEIGLECIGADFPVFKYIDALVNDKKRKACNKLKASQRKAWAKACGVAE